MRGGASDDEDVGYYVKNEILMRPIDSPITDHWIVKIQSIVPWKYKNKV